MQHEQFCTIFCSQYHWKIKDLKSKHLSDFLNLFIHTLNLNAHLSCTLFYLHEKHG